MAFLESARRYWTGKPGGINLNGLMKPVERGEKSSAISQYQESLSQTRESMRRTEIRLKLSGRYPQDS